MANRYRERASRGTKRARWKLAGATALAVLLFAADALAGGALRAYARDFASLAFRSALAVSRWTDSFFVSRGALESRNGALSARIASLEAQLAGDDALRGENEKLRALLGLASTTRGVAAPVVSSARSSPYGTFLIGAGFAQGIAPGDLALTGGGFVAGSVSETSARTSLVEETFAPGRSIDAIVGSATLPLAGEGGGMARAEAPRDLPVKIGDAAFAPSLGERPVGIVGAIASSSASATQDLYIRLPANLESLQYVYVVAPF